MNIVILLLVSCLSCHNKDIVKRATVLICFLSPRAKEIKSKLGVLLQKPENAIDLIIPYPEKTEKKPEKLQKWVPLSALYQKDECL